MTHQPQNPDHATSPATTTPGPINWWFNPTTHKADPFVTLQVDENGRLPTYAVYELGDGMQLIYAEPISYREDYALMPEALVAQRVDAFIGVLDDALDTVPDDELPWRFWLACGLLCAAWLVNWLFWRWLV